ncbi:MAG: ABC transporter substrate-binding protein, partial [Planctomycetota bacterium]
MERRSKRFWVMGWITIAIVGLIVSPAMAGKKDDTLIFASERELENNDNYFNTAREGIIIARHIWDNLIYRDPETFEYKPLLATSWKWVNDVTIEAELRKGVKFHNGEKFDADDVVYTLNWVSDPKNGVKNQTNVKWIKSAEKLGEYKVRIHLKKPFPPALEFLAGPVCIYPNEYYAKVGPDGMHKEPIGTGPYKVTKVIQGKEIRFEANKDYFDSPKGKPAISKMVFKTIPDKSSQMAELMA